MCISGFTGVLSSEKGLKKQQAQNKLRARVLVWKQMKWEGDIFFKRIPQAYTGTVYGMPFLRLLPEASTQKWMYSKFLVRSYNWQHSWSLLASLPESRKGLLNSKKKHRKLQTIKCATYCKLSFDNWRILSSSREGQIAREAEKDYRDFPFAVKERLIESQCAALLQSLMSTWWRWNHTAGNGELL